MFTIKEYVPAAEIWPNAENHIDYGYKSGLVRGYNVEVSTVDGVTAWLSCSYIHEDPEEYFNDEFHQWLWNEHQWTPTGRICFRGYAVEKYDVEEHDFYVVPVNDEDIEK